MNALTVLLVIIGVVSVGMLGLLGWAGWQLWIDHEEQKAHDQRLANLQRICEAKPWPTSKGPKGIQNKFPRVEPGDKISGAFKC